MIKSILNYTRLIKLGLSKFPNAIEMRRWMNNLKIKRAGGAANPAAVVRWLIEV